MSVHWLTRGLEQLPDGEAWLSPAELERAGRMRYAKRRSEFLAARFAAKHAIARAVGMPTEDVAALSTVEVRHRPSGAPMAFVAGEPAGVAMSLTDRADWAVCIVSNGNHVSLGCDLELVEPRSAGFVRDYLTASEQDAVHAADDPHLVANLMWSAKESALKVLQTGLRRDTRTVEVTLIDTPPDQVGGEAASEWRPLEVRPVEGGVFPGWWRRFDRWLLSVASSAPSAPPKSLEQPNALESALPGHRWMQAMRD
jgi:4'-phosphopantetheinyl transferase